MKVAWFSAGVSSFIAAYLVKDTVDKVIFNDIDDEHPDTLRFLKECETALGIPIEIIKSKYGSVDTVCRMVRYINGPAGAPCSKRLKVHPRLEWEAKNPGTHTYIWGIDPDEAHRTHKIIDNNPHMTHEFPLIDHGISKKECHYMLEKMGIKRPLMYDLGYPNNNCVGCVKGGMGYWNKIRIDFPEVFESRAKLERDIGASMLKDTNGKIFLDDLDPSRGQKDICILPECDVLCQITYATDIKYK